MRTLITLWMLTFILQTAYTQSCGCCGTPGCPCEADCRNTPVASKPKSTEKATTANKNTKSNPDFILKTIESDIPCMVSIKNKSFHVAPGVNHVSAIQCSNPVEYQIKTSSGYTTFKTYRFQQNDAQNNFCLKVVERANEQNWLRKERLEHLLRSLPLAFITNDVLPGLEICKFETSVFWYETFIQQSNYVGSAERKGKTTVRCPECNDDILKDGISWAHDPFGALQVSKTHPVVHISWSDASAFCNWLSGLDTKYTYRLPTFSEWNALFKQEYKNNVPIAPNSIPISNLADTSLFKTIKYKKKPALYLNDHYTLTAPTGSFPAGQTGLFDLAGNVAEWLEDNPYGNSGGSSKIFIGGSYFSNPDEVARLNFAEDQQTLPGVGFRIVRLPRL